VHGSRRYPQAIRGPAAGSRLDWENDAVLLVLQGSQGLIGREINAASVQADPDRIVIHVCLREDSEAVREDLDDLVFEVGELMGGVVEPMVEVTVSTYVGDTGPEWPGYVHRRLFLINDRDR
jgi:hypothetical protein